MYNVCKLVLFNLEEILSFCFYVLYKILLGFSWSTLCSYYILCYILNVFHSVEFPLQIDFFNNKLKLTLQIF